MDKSMETLNQTTEPILFFIYLLLYVVLQAMVREGEQSAAFL